MLSVSILVLALFGPALAPAPHAAAPDAAAPHAAARGATDSELRPIAWQGPPRARALASTPAAAPASAELRDPFDIAPQSATPASMAVDPWALREPFTHGPRQAKVKPAAPAPAPAAAAAEPVVPRTDVTALREPAWAR